MKFSLAGICGLAVLLVISGYSFIWAQGPELTPMIYLDGDDAISAAAGNQFTPDVEIGNNMYLFAWEDNRSNLITNNNQSQSGTDIYAARADADGALLDSIPIVVSQAPNTQNNPEVHWNGENWLVVWESLDINPAGTYYSAHIRAARISPQGELLDNPPVNVYSYPWSTDAMFAATSAESNWVVVCQGTSSGENDILGFKISPEGEVLNPNGTVVLEAAYYLRFNLNLVFATDELFMVWKAISEIKALRISPELQAIGAEFRVSPTSGYTKNRPTVATDGYDYLLGWEDYLQNWYSNPMVARISHAGELLDVNGILLRQMGGYGIFPSLAWDGTNWIAAWADLYAARISSEGEVLDPNGVLIPGAKVNAVSPAGGGGVMVAYSDGSINLPHNNDIFAIELESDLSAGQPHCVSLSAPNQVDPDFAGQGDLWMAAYASYLSDDRRILVRPFDEQGTPLTDEPVQIANSPFLDNPAIAFNGTYFFVAWHDASDDKIYGRRVDLDGTPIDSSPIFLMNGYECDVAAAGDDFGVIANYFTTYVEFVFPFFVRVDGPTGEVLDQNPINLGASYVRVPVVSSFDGRWLAAWQRHYSHDEAHDDLMAAFVDSDGNPSPEFTVAAGPYRYGPAIGASPEEALIAWQDPRVNFNNWNIYARRLLPDGQLLDNNSIGVSLAQENQGNSSAAWDGSYFLVLYEDRRNIDYFFDNRTDIYGTRVGLDGSVIDPEGFVFSDESIPEMQPAVAATDGFAVLGASILYYQQPYGAYRVGIRLMGTPTAVDEKGTLPENYQILFNYPNPFNSETTIKFSVSEPGMVNLEIFNVLGQKVCSLVDGYYPNGTYRVDWKAADQASGIYYYRLNTGSQSLIESMTLLK